MKTIASIRDSVLQLAGGLDGVDAFFYSVNPIGKFEAGLVY